MLDEPIKIEGFLSANATDSWLDSLGFGWTKKNLTVFGNSIVMYADLYYLDDKLETFILKTFISLNKKQVDKRDLLEYQSEYPKLLHKIDTANFYEYKYGEEKILKPLEQLKATGLITSCPSKIQYYMSPLSGIEYGYRAGLKGTLVENRQHFKALQDSINEYQVETMMYAINPASRLTAIEYYLKNKQKFSNTQRIDKWVETVFTKVPFATTITGCKIERQSLRTAIEYFRTQSD